MLMLDEKVWLTVSAAIHPKHLPLGRAQDSLQVSSVLFYHPHPGLYGPCFVHWGSHIGAGKGNPPKVFPQSWEHKTVQTAMECCSIKSFFHWIWGADPNSWTSHLAQYYQKSTVLLATTKSRLIVIVHSRGHVSTALQSSGSLTFYDTHHVRLGCNKGKAFQKAPYALLFKSGGL